MLGGSHPDAGCLNCGDGAVLSPMGWWSTVTTLWLEEDVPAGADLGRTTGEPAEPVAAVDVQVPVALDGQDVGLGVAGPVAVREHRGEDVPAGADLGRATGEPAKPVAVVKVQVPGAGLGQEVGLAVAGEVAGREYANEAGGRRRHRHRGRVGGDEPFGSQAERGADRRPADRHRTTRTVDRHLPPAPDPQPCR